jgi:hypothetical protein
MVRLSVIGIAVVPSIFSLLPYFGYRLLVHSCCEDSFEFYNTKGPHLT